MPGTYKLLTAFLAFTGCLSLVISGEINPAFLTPGLALIYGYYRFIKGAAPLPGRVVGALSAAALVALLFDAIFVSSDFFLAVAHMTITFQAIKSFDLKEPWDHLQVYFMAILQLVMTSELTFSIAVGAVFVLFLAVQIAAMVLSHFIKEGTLGKVSVKRPLVLISLSAFLMSAVFFVAIPRFKGGVLGRKASSTIKSVGFSEKVEFGSFGDVLKDETIVMRAELSGDRLPLYWRGVTLNHFDGLSWKDTTGAKRSIYRTDGRFTVRDSEWRSVQRVFIEPLDTAAVFGLGDIVALESPGNVIMTDEAGALFLPAKSDRRFSYTVYSVPGPGEPAMPVTNVKRYLSVPEGMREPIAGLAAQVAAGGSDLQRAKAIEGFLRDNFRYSLLTAPPPSGMTPVEDFLFSSKTGFCEHFSTAMILLLRASGIPSRLVTGFSGGQVNDYGDYVIVRQSNAHSWVEALIGGKWLRFDPTPAEDYRKASLSFLFLDSLRMKWYRYVVGFSSADQRTLVRSLSVPVFELPAIRLKVRPVYIVFAAAGIFFFMAAVLLRGASFVRQPYETRLYLRFRRAVKGRGGSVGPSSTSRGVMREALRLRMNEEDVREFIRLYEEARFGGKGGFSEKRLRSLYKSLLASSMRTAR